MCTLAFEGYCVVGHKGTGKNGSDLPLHTLHNVRFPHHGVVSVLGPNGAGKTTFFKTIMGILPLLTNSGHISYPGYNDNYDADLQFSKPLAGTIGFIPQNIDIAQDMEVSDWLCLAFSARYNMFFTPSDIQRGQARRAMYKVQLPVEYLTRRIKTLSGGEVRKVALARLLLQECRIFILDELYSQLDLGAIEEIRELIAEIVRTDEILVIQSMHQIQLALDTSDLVLPLYKSRPGDTHKASLISPKKVDDSTIRSLYGVPLWEKPNQTVSVTNSGLFVLKH